MLSDSIRFHLKEKLWTDLSNITNTSCKLTTMDGKYKDGKDKQDKIIHVDGD